MLVIQHDRRAAGRARAQLERAVGVLIVEGLPVQARGVIDIQVAMFEKDDMSRRLPGYALADGAVASVVVYRVVV